MDEILDAVDRIVLRYTLLCNEEEFTRDVEKTLIVAVDILICSLCICR